MNMIKKIVGTMLVLLLIPNVSMASTTELDASQSVLTMMKSELYNNGFTPKELSRMENEIPELHEIVTNNDLSDAQLINLKKTFLNIHEVDDSNVEEYPVDNNGIVDLGAYKTIVPHPEYYTGELGNVNAADLQTANAASSGVHVMTYSDPSYRFFKSTAYIDLPDVQVKYNPGSTYPYNSRPYMMYGAYGNGGGFDTGLVYYEETGTWRLFRNVLGSGWAEKNISLSGNRAYLWMELNGRNTIIKVIDPATWTEVGSMTVPAPTSFTTNPSNVSITREVALAQFVRENNGDYMKDAHWNQVYYYKIDGTNTLATAQYVLSNVNGRYSYDSSMPKYLIGDTLADKAKVHITPQSNYSAEWVDIVLS